MKRNYITVGTQIDTATGCLVVNGYNSHIVWCKAFEANEDGDLEPVDDEYLTLSEIGRKMKEIDSQEHKVIWEEMTNKTICEKAFENGLKVREKESGIIAEVVEAFGDGELYLDEGTTGISPVSEYNADDFEIVEA